MKKVFFILIAFFMLNLQSFATTWVQVGKSDYIDKDSVKYYVNDRGEVQFEKKTCWMKAFNDGSDYFKQIQDGLDKKISYVISQRIIDTNKKAITTKSIIYYDEQKNSIFSHTSGDYELTWSPVVPNSNGELWFELIKKPRYLTKMYKYQLEQQN